jgi:hypothetical protein
MEWPVHWAVLSPDRVGPLCLLANRRFRPFDITLATTHLGSPSRVRRLCRPPPRAVASDRAFLRRRGSSFRNPSPRVERSARKCQVWLGTERRVTREVPGLVHDQPLSTMRLVKFPLRATRLRCGPWHRRRTAARPSLDPGGRGGGHVPGGGGCVGPRVVRDDGSELRQAGGGWPGQAGAGDRGSGPGSLASGSASVSVSWNTLRNVSFRISFRKRGSTEAETTKGLAVTRDP